MRAFAVLLVLTLPGCVATRITTPEGLALTRVSIGSDVSVRAKRGADGAVSVEESQGQALTQELLDLLGKVAP